MGERIKDCRILVPLIVEYYERPDNGAGGSLHIVLDDGNYETDSVEYCQRYAWKEGDWAGAALARLMLMCSYTQRKKANAMAHDLMRRKWIATRGW